MDTGGFINEVLTLPKQKKKKKKFFAHKQKSIKLKIGARRRSKALINLNNENPDMGTAKV